MSDLSNLSDESLLRYYDSIREQVDADRGNTRKLSSAEAIKQRAEALRKELVRRGLSFTPINWV